MLMGLGCGNDGEPQQTRAQPPGKAKFIVRAAAECREGQGGLREEIARFVRAQRPSKPRPVLTADVAHFILLPPIEAQIGRLYELIETLGTPVGDKERIDEMLVLERRAIDEVATTARIDSLRAVYEPFEESARLFRAYGLGACANGPKPPQGISISTSPAQ